MKLFKKYRTLWMMGIIIVCVILFITNFSYVVSGVNMLVRSVSSLVGGAALAFILNLIMEPAEKKYLKSDKDYVRKHARTLAILTSFVIMFALIILVLSIIIPNLVSAIKMLTSEAPTYLNEVDGLLQRLFKNYPSVAEKFASNHIDWEQMFQMILSFLTKGTGTSNIMDNTMNLMTSFVGFFVNSFVVIVFAAYVLAEKERFVQGYYTWLDLYVGQRQRSHITRDLRILNQSFKSFIAGECIEALILSTMCIIGMWILQLPYATMIGILVGVINMIPMVGAFIGGGIGAFIIFTISPTKCLIFLVFLCVIQQIESNVFFPRVIGNKVGLPGIYVMMTIVIGGTLFGVMGMILGVPLMASVYKILKIDLAEVKRRREQENERKQNQKNENESSAKSKGFVHNVRSEMEQLRASMERTGESSAQGGRELESEEIEAMIQADDELRTRLDDLLLIEEDDRPACKVDGNASAGTVALRYSGAKSSVSSGNSGDDHPDPIEKDVPAANNPAEKK